jgi:hypothetical protein
VKVIFQNLIEKRKFLWGERDVHVVHYAGIELSNVPGVLNLLADYLILWVSSTFMAGCI